MQTETAKTIKHLASQRALIVGKTHMGALGLLEHPMQCIDARPPSIRAETDIRFQQAAVTEAQRLLDPMRGLTSH